LWTVTAHVLDRDRVSPGNVVRRNAQDGSQALALRWTGSVVAADDGLNQFRIQPRGSGELAKADAGLFHVASYWLHYGRHLITFTDASTDCSNPRVVFRLAQSFSFSPACTAARASRVSTSSSLAAHVTERLTISRNAVTCAWVHSSQRNTGIPAVSPPSHDPNLRAALIR